MRPAVEPLPHVESLLASTQGSRFFTKIDLERAYNQLLVRERDRWKTSFRCQLGQFQWNVVPFGIQGASSLLMRVMREALTTGLGDHSGAGPGGPGGIPGATGPLGRSEEV